MPVKVANKIPFVSCLCPTADRRHILRRAIECFRWQSYASNHRELVILDDGEDRVEDVVTTFGSGLSSIRYVSEGAKELLGHKRNRLVELARGDILLLWDDDDWHGPDRVLAQVNALQEADLCLLDKIRLQDINGHVWEQAHGGWRFPGTTAFRRSVWEDRQFPIQPIGADLEFGLHRENVVTIDGTMLYRVIHHDTHHTPFETSGWVRRADVRTINVKGGL